MGTATSVIECKKRYEWLPAVNCTAGSVPFGEFGSNASITGIGTDISFVLTAGLSLLTCGLVQLFCDRLRFHSWRKLLEPLVVSFGDQQILRGLSLSIATLYSSSACTIDTYRYNILCYLLMMTIVSHMSSVLVLRSYVNGQIMLSCVRFMLVFAQSFFAGVIFSARVTSAFPTHIPSRSETDIHNTTLVFPAVCFEHGNAKPYTGFEGLPSPHAQNVPAVMTYAILFVFYSINLIITIAHVLTYIFWKDHTWQELVKKEEKAKSYSWWWWMGIVRGIILLSAWIIWIWCVIQMYSMKAWMTGSGWMSGENLQNDDQWTFGQWLNVLLLAAAPMTVLGAWSDFKQANRDEKKRRRELAALAGPSYVDVPQSQDDVPLTPYLGSNSTSHLPSYSSQAALLRPDAQSQSRYSSRTTFESLRSGSGVGSGGGYAQRPTSY